MRPSKGRTIEKKRVNKANKITKTERSRKQRIANKHKREEINAIDPDMKVIVMNQKTFDKHGTEIEVMDNKIKAVTSVDYDDTVIEYQKVINKYPDSEVIDTSECEHTNFAYVKNATVIKEIKTKNKSALQRLTAKFKKGIVL